MHLLSIFFGLFFISASIHAAENVHPVTTTENGSLPAPLTLTTEAFHDNGALPTLYTCDSENISPQLSWSNAPKKTQSFAIIFVDPTALKDKKYLWIIFNIPPTITSLEQGIKQLPQGAIQGKNTYTGPCPPKGSVHTYVFALYALDSKLPLTPGADGETVIKSMANHVLEKSQITAVYSRWPE